MNRPSFASAALSFLAAVCIVLSSTDAHAATAATPTFSPGGGTYNSTQSVTISDSTSGATIYYTTDGSTPTTGSTKYQGTAISVSVTTKVQAIATATGFTQSSVGSATYTIVPPGTSGTLQVFISPPGAQSTTVSGVATETFNEVTLTGNKYGSNTLASAIGNYAGNSTRIPIIAADQYGGANSSQYMYVGSRTTGDSTSVTLTLTSPVNYFGFWWSAGDQNNRVALYSGSTLYGTFSTADLLSFLNNGQGAITASNGTQYSAGSYFGNPNITSGSNDSTEPFAYVSFVITGNATINKIVFYNQSSSGFESDNHSVISSGGSVVIPSTYAPVETLTLGTQVVTPVLIPNYNIAPMTVGISTTTAGASINYTTDGSAPTTSHGTLYAGPITVAQTETVKAIGFETGLATSSVASATYTIPTLTVASSGTPSTYGNSVTFTATISSGPTGAITFYDSGTSIGTGTISGGSARLTTSTLAGGSHSITASWLGNSTYGSVLSSAITQTVNQAAPTISFTVPNQTYGVAPFTVSAISNSSGAITYSVVSGPATISGSTVTVTGVGTVVLKASQAASGNYAAGTQTTSFTVAAAAPTISFTVPNQTYGVAPFTVSATSNSSGVITYSVVSGPTTISGSTVTITGMGTVVLRASQAATTTYAASTASTNFSVVAATPTVTVTSTTGTYGTPLTLTATSTYLNNGVATATGQTPIYTLISGPATLSSGILTFTGTGSVVVTTSVSATGNFGAATSPQTTITVIAGSSFTLAASPASLNIGQGGSSTSTITVTGANGFSGSVNLAASGLPSGVTAAFATNPATATSVLTLTASSSATVGSATITITGTSGSLNASTSIALTVTAQCATNGYGYVRAIDIDHTKVPNTDQINFPFLFSTTDPLLKTAANGGHIASPDGYDIIFTSDPAGKNPLPYEMEEYNPATGQVVAWVQIPNVSHSSDTVIYLFYGNPNITTSQQNPTAVWDSNYKGVYHLPNGSVLSAQDSTSNSINGTLSAGSPPTATTGEIGGGASFMSSSDQYITMGNSLDISTQDFTIEYWLDASNTNQFSPVVAKRNPSNYAQYQSGIGSVNGSGNGVAGKTIYFFGYDSSNLFGYHTTNNVIDGNWHHVAVTRSGSMLLIYVDGNLASTTQDSAGTGGAENLSNTGNFNIGFDNGTSYFNGAADEVRISVGLARSADWIAAGYANQSSPATFYALSGENAIEAVPATVSLLASQSQQFAIPGICGGAVAWSMPNNAPGSLSSSGLYTAPASFTEQQTVTITGQTQTENLTSATVTLVPQIWPNGGPAGTVATINGAGFGSTEGPSSVTVGGLPAVTLAWAASQIQVQIPTGTGLGNQQVVVTVGNQTLAQGTFNVTTGLVGITPPSAGVTAATTINLTSQSAPLIFNGTAEQLVSVQLSNSTFTTIANSLYFAILNPDGSTLNSQNINNNHITNPVTLPKDGVYTLVAYPGYGTGSANFTLREFSNLTGTIIQGVPYPLSINIPDQKALLTFSGVAGQIATIGISNDTFTSWGGTVTFSILDPDGTAFPPVSLCAATVYGCSLNTNGLILLKTGTYTISVDPGGATGSTTLLLTESLPSINITPASIALGERQTQQFSATMVGSTTNVANWTVSPATGGGKITATGYYTAPEKISTSQIVTVTATTSTGGSPISTTARITLVPPAPAISVQPSNVVLTAGQIKQFSATVNDTTNAAVTWTISPGGTGSIDAVGNYTAPAVINSQQVVTITATSQADAALSATATVTLITPTECYTNGYSYLRAITVDHTKVPNTDQTNFPFLFSTTDPLLATTANGGHVANPNGYDIIFTSDPAGLNPLPYEMQGYDPTKGQAIAWVQIPDLSHTSDTTIYLFYGNSSITKSQQNSTGTWDSNYGGVWHLSGSGATISTADSTANANNATLNGTVSVGPGIIGNGASLIGASGYFDAGNQPSVQPTTTGTMSAWIDSAVFGNFVIPIGNGDTSGTPESGALWTVNSGGYPIFTVDNTCWYCGDEITGSQLSLGQWYYLTGTWNGSFVNLYVNGAFVTSMLQKTDAAPCCDLKLGWGLNGTIQEARVSNIARSADWIATEYSNQSSPTSFYSLSPEGRTIIPGAVTLYPQQSQQFALPGMEFCPASIAWSMSPSVGTLTQSGLYIAPPNITTQQVVTITATNTLNNEVTSAAVTLMPSTVNPTLSLAASTPSPYITESTATFVATLKNMDGTVLSGVPVSFTVTGTNPGTGTGITDSNGKVSFSYSGATSGTDTVQAAANIGVVQVTSGAVTAIWLVPSQPVSTSPVYGAFYPTDNQCVFDTAEAKTPAFTETFPTINFNPPSGTILGNISGVGVYSRPFTDVTTDQDGNYTGTIVAEGNGYQAGVGPMFYFEAVFTGEITVANSGYTVFDFYDDDGFIFGIGNGATRVSGASINMPPTSVFNGYPSMGADNDGQSPIGNQVIVNFPAAGTYPYEVDYTECDSGSLVLTMTQGATNATGIAPTASLTLSPNSINPLPFGGSQTFTVSASDASGNPVPNVHVGLVVTGVDSLQLSGITDSSGNINIVYKDVNPGTANVQAIAYVGGMVTYSNMVTVPWTLPAGSSTGSGGSGTLAISISAQSPVVLPNTPQLNGSATDSALPAGTSPSVTWSEVNGPGTVTFANAAQASTTATFSSAGTYVLELSATDSQNSGSAQLSIQVDATAPTAQGWIGSPATGSAVSGIVPITVASGETLTSCAVTVYPANNPNAVTPLSCNTNSGTSQIATWDTTQLRNGTYWITLQATDSNDNSQYSLSLVTVTGNYKPGRVTTTVTDLVVPATGLPIQIQRTYDSLNASTIGDFGYGWNLGINTQLTVDNKGDVTFTLGGQRKTFYLTPQILGCGLVGCLFPWYSPVFTPETGLFGTLTDSGAGCTFDMLLADGECVGGGQYTPPGYIYTDPSGTQYTIGAGGQLQSVLDKNGNGLTIGPNGITSTTGLNVPFVRDAQNRITQITDPAGNVYSYGYDANGNLASVTYPPTPNAPTCLGASASNTSQYSYYPSAEHPNYPAHFYAGGTDGRCYSLPSTTYYDSSNDGGNSTLDGRLASVTDAAGNTTSYSYVLSATSTINGAQIPNTGITTVTYPKDANGNAGTATMIYDSQGDLLQSTDPLGHTTTNTYNANFKLLSTTDPLGHTTSYTYDADGNKTSITYPATATSTNTTSTVSYNQFSEPVSITDENGNTRTFTYDANYNPLAVTDSLGIVMSTQSNASGQLLSGAAGYDIRQSPAHAAQFGYDANGNLTSKTDALGRTTSYTYNALGQLISITEPAPNSGVGSPSAQMQRSTTHTMAALRTTANKVNAAFHLQSESPGGSGSGGSGNPPSGGSGTVTITYIVGPDGNRTQESASWVDGGWSATYDAHGNMLTFTDPLGNTTSYGYDPLNRLVLIAYPDKTTTSYTYDSRNNVVTITDQAGHVTLNSYDLAGQLISVTQAYGTPNAATTTYTYDAAGRKASVTDPLGHTTTYTYDQAGNVLSVSGPQGIATYTYDNARNKTSMTDGNGNTTQYAYDARNRLTTTTYPDETTEVITYNAMGKIASKTSRSGAQSQYLYDNAGELQSVVKTTSPNPENSTAYTYDAASNLLSWADANGHTTAATYDPFGNPLSKTLPDGQLSESAQYDAASNLLNLTHFNGASTAYTYDSMGRVLSRATPGEPGVSYTYTPTSQVATTTDASGTTTYGYDSLDRLISKATPEGTLTYTYDAAGHVASVSSSNANGANVSYTYDNLNRLSTVVDNRLGGATTTYTYDSNNNVKTVTYPNLQQATLTFTPMNEVSKLATQNSAYTYQLQGGNLTGVAEQGGRTVNWSYDGIQRLTGETIASDPSGINGVATYGLDPVGNRLSLASGISGLSPATNTFDVDDRLSSETYDPNGNAKIVAGSTYTFDSQNQLVSADAGAITQTYDAFGNRVAKTVNGVTTQYLVDDLSPTGYPQVVDELTNGAVTRTYTYGFMRIDEEQLVNGAWTTSYYGYDGGGHVRQLTSPTGAVTDTYAYDAYGNLLNQTGTTPNSYRYRGEQYDSDLNLYYLRARWYNPATGRFLSHDPLPGWLAEPSTLHRYNYASTNPVNRIDPSGRADLIETEIVEEPEEVAEAGEEAAGKEVECSLSIDASLVQAAIDYDWSGDETGVVQSLVLIAALPQKCEAEQKVKECCFAAGTPVHTDHGDVPIEKIKIGDEVEARDSATGKLETEPVTALTPRHPNTLVELRIEGERDPLRPSLDHPFWVRRGDDPIGVWILAGKLRLGDLLETPDGNWRRITAITPIAEEETVYNFTVDKDHDYFVGETGFLVHNASGCGCGPQNPLDGLPRVGSALKKDPYHAFPDIVDNYAGDAIGTPLRSGVMLYQLLGSLNGNDGRFEWIVDNDRVTHRFFCVGGGLNGVPIVP